MKKITLKKNQRKHIRMYLNKRSLMGAMSLAGASSYLGALVQFTSGDSLEYSSRLILCSVFVLLVIGIFLIAFSYADLDKHKVNG